MDVTAAITTTVLAALACGLGACGLGHRLLNRGDIADAHCGAQPSPANLLSRLTLLLASVVVCGLAMAGALAYFGAY